MTIATAIAAVVLAAAPVGGGDVHHMLMEKVSPASFFHGRVLLELSKEASRLLCRCCLQPGSLFEQIAARLKKLAEVLQ